MMSCEKGKFPYSFFILLTQRHECPAPKLTNFHIFIIPLPLNVTSFSKSPYLTAHIKINYETGCIGRISEKNTEMYPEPSRHLRWSSLWHELVALSRKDNPFHRLMNYLNSSSDCICI